MARILDSGGKITVVLQDDHAIYLRRDKMIQSEGAINVSVTIPTPQNATIARVLNNALAMQKITTGTEGGRVVLTSPGGKQLIGIRLSREDRFVVSFSHIVGYSKRPRFATYANLSVAAFACDRNFSTIASGPGILILETSGNHVIHEAGRVVFDPELLIAWDPGMRFKLDKVDSLTDLYLNRVRLSCEIGPDTLPVIVDSAPKKDAVAANPLWGFLKSVYWPRLY